MFDTDSLIFAFDRPGRLERAGGLLRLLGLVALLALWLQPAPRWKTERRLILMDGREVTGLVEEKPYGYNVKSGSDEIQYLKKEEVLVVAGIREFRVPFWILIACAFYLWLFLPAIFFAVAYALAAFAAAWLNALHALATGRTHDELTRFLIKQLAYEAKVQVAVVGLVDPLPHIDVYGREVSSFPLAFLVRPVQVVPRLVAFGRVTLVLPALVLIPYLVLFALHQIVFLTLIPVHWVLVGITGRGNAFVTGLMEIALRFQFRLRLFLYGLSGRLPPVLGTPGPEKALNCDFSAADEQFFPTPRGYFGTGSARSLEMNLPVLGLLLVCSGGLYCFLWLARVAKAAGHDAFSVVVVSIFLPLLPLSIIFVRYYRRFEKALKNEPAPVLEVLAAVPLLNVFFGTILVQFVLNEYERARRMVKQ